jgi:O-antigen/teichoic acid export membrane protein
MATSVSQAETDPVSPDRRPTGRSLTGDAGLLAIGLILSQGLTILSLSVVARLVPKADVGAYQQLSLLYGIISPLLSGIPAGLLYFLARARDHREIEDWVMRAYAVLGIAGLVSALATVLLREQIAELMGDPQVAQALVPYAPYIFFAFLSSAASAILIPTRHARAASILTANIGLCSLLGVLIAVVLRPDTESIALGLSCGAAVSTVVCLVVVQRMLHLGLRLRRSMFTSWRPLLNYSLPLAAAGVAGKIGYQFDRIVVSANFSPAQFAVYALGAVELPISLLVQWAVSMVLTPELTRMWRDGNVKAMIGLWRTAFEKSTLIAAPMFWFAMLYAHDVIRVLYGTRFDQSVILFQIYLSFIPLRIAVWGLIPQAIGNTRVNLGAAAIILVCNAVIALSLVGPLGLKGPAFAAPVSTVVAAAYYLIRIRRLTGISARALIPLRYTLACFGLAGVLAGVTSILRQLDMPAAPDLVVGLVVFTPAYVFAARRLQLIGEPDWLRLRSLASGPMSGVATLVGKGRRRGAGEDVAS